MCVTATDSMPSVACVCALECVGICRDDSSRVMGGLQHTGQHRAAEADEGKDCCSVAPDVGVNGNTHKRREELLGDPLFGTSVEVEVCNGHMTP